MQVINSKDAPKAIGTYNHAVKVDNLVFISGQIGLDPISMQMCSEDVRAQVYQVFANLRAVCRTSGGDLTDIAKLTVYLIDISYSPIVNEVMQELFSNRYPARAMLQVSKLPKDAQVEIDAIMAVNNHEHSST